MTKTGHFKFLHADHLPYLLDQGTLKISSNEYFRREYAAMEVPNAWINDPNEGRIIEVQDRPITSKSSPLEIERLARTGFGRMIDLRSLDNVDISHNVIVHENPPFHMFCFAHGPFDLLAEEFCGSAAAERTGTTPYSACVEITDFEGFKGRVMRSVVATPAGDVSMLSIWGGFYDGPVGYAPIQRNWTGPIVPPSPYVKALEFEAQREYRFMFDPDRAPDPRAARAMPETCILKVPGLADVLKPVSL